MKSSTNHQTPTDLAQLAQDISDIHEISDIAEVIERIYVALEQHPFIDDQCIPDMRREGQGYEIARRRGRLRVWGPVDGRYGVASLSAIDSPSAHPVSLIKLLRARTREQMVAICEPLTPEWMRRRDRGQAAEVAKRAKAE